MTPFLNRSISFPRAVRHPYGSRRVPYLVGDLIPGAACASPRDPLRVPGRCRSAESVAARGCRGAELRRRGSRCGSRRSGFQGARRAEGRFRRSLCRPQPPCSGGRRLLVASRACTPQAAPASDSGMRQDAPDVVRRLWPAVARAGKASDRHAPQSPRKRLAACRSLHPPAGGAASADQTAPFHSRIS